MIIIFILFFYSYVSLNQWILRRRRKKQQRMTSYLRHKFKIGSISSSSSSELKVEEDVDDQEEVLEFTDTLEINDIERTKIKMMRTIVEAEDPSSKDEEDDYMVRRFLRARDFDIEKASTLFLKYRKWRKEFVPNGFISPSEIPNDLAHNK